MAMVQIVIDQIDEVMHTKLASLARENHVSIEDQAKKLLINAFDRIERRRQRVEIVNKIASMTPKGIEQTDSTLLLREDRDR